MKRGHAVSIVLLVCAFPTFASAQVVINEVMYNPAGSDTGREWVELYNEGASDVTMVGGSGKGSWRLSDGSNHTLTDPAGGTGRGSLVVPAGGYLVIANDPNDFLTGEYAGGTYSVVKSSISLNNNGGTITLLDGTGATVDTFTYTPSQGGNDDGSSLQRQADGSWIAALPTPGAANSSTPYVPPPTQTSDSNSQSASESSADAESQAEDQNSSYVPPPAPSLYADAGGDKEVIVGADVEFDASAYDKTQTLLDPTTVRFLWNFGDGATAEGNSVLHHFSYPGRYAVSLEIAQNRNAAGDQITITADPAALSFALLPDGGIQIQNLAGRDLDLSDWVVRGDSGAFAAQFILPDDSKILASSSMAISPQTLSFRASSSTVLEYPNGAPALQIGMSTAPTASSSAGESAPDETNSAPEPQPVEAPAISGAANQPTVQTSDPDPTLADTDDSSATDTRDDFPDAASTATATVLQAAAASSQRSGYAGWIGIAALALAIAAAAVAALHFKKGEWSIVEDSAE